MNKYLEFPFVKRHRLKILAEIGERELGLEIGPFDKPWIRKSEHCVKYYDRFTVDELAKRVNSNRDVSSIVELDFVCEELTDIGMKFDYIVGVHMFEHVPNPVKFLQMAYRLLKNGGRLFLVIPDCRYTFDACRRTTEIEDYLSWYVEGRNMPSVATVFDSVYNACGPVDHRKLWKEPSLRMSLRPTRNIRAAYERASKSTSEYHDCHVTVTDSDRFRALVDALKMLHLMEFVQVDVHDTEVNANDFLVVFRK